jgi:hypothetical protein
MSSSKLPNPEEFEDVHLVDPSHEKFPPHLPSRPGESKSYLGTLMRTYKFRIMICTLAFLLMMGGTVAAAVFISKGMQRIHEGQAAITALSMAPISTATPTPSQLMVTQVSIATRTEVETDHITIPVSRLQSTIYAIATAPAPRYGADVWERGDAAGRA